MPQNKKHQRAAFRLENGDAKLIERASELSGLKSSEICRRGSVALAEKIIRQKGKIRFPVRIR